MIVTIRSLCSLLCGILLFFCLGNTQSHAAASGMQPMLTCDEVREAKISIRSPTLGLKVLCLDQGGSVTIPLNPRETTGIQVCNGKYVSTSMFLPGSGNPITSFPPGICTDFTVTQKDMLEFRVTAIQTNSAQPLMNTYPLCGEQAALIRYTDPSAHKQLVCLSRGEQIKPALHPSSPISICSGKQVQTVATLIVNKVQQVFLIQHGSCDTLHPATPAILQMIALGSKQ